MNMFLLLAGCLMILVGLIHSFLGEKLIFSHLRMGQVVPTHIGIPLRERHIRIIWATWHIVSILGFGMAGLLFWLALSSTSIENQQLIKNIIATPMLLSAMLVLWATKGRHPGWVGLSLVAIFIWVS
jgi:drug/metabolite transporter (DMT)-like permease